MIKIITLLLLASANCFAGTFGYQSEDKEPSFAISADMVKFDEIEVYPDASKSQYQHLNELILCATNKALDECYPEKSDGVIKGYRGDDSFLLGLKSLSVDGYIKWGNKITYTVRYRSGRSDRTKKGLVSFNCSDDKCYPLNALSHCSYTGCSTSNWTVLATITSIYDDGTEIVDVNASKKLSSFCVLSEHNDISVHMDIEKLQSELPVALHYQDIFKTTTACLKDGACNEAEQIPRLLGQDYATHLYAVHKFDNDEHQFSGLLSAATVFDVFKRSDNCEAALSLEVLNAQVIVSKCQFGNEQFFLINQYKGDVFTYDYETEYVVYLMATKAFAGFVKNVLNVAQVPYKNNDFINEVPNLQYK
ncbi:hypothetical protein [Motilimonas sp. E26]|uniref:hypothetical protein n=1 Tax=Motilimonas sp. E26 TaxID=2865674 RepID=UPI001E28263B|nr:hypothetical protein [Motilimonas sp. E26]MCE0558922.1 hypothetical protein [Motilimonas sp. E26]